MRKPTEEEIQKLRKMNHDDMDEITTCAGGKELLQKIENLLTQQKTEQKTIEEVIDHTKTYGKCFDNDYDCNDYDSCIDCPYLMMIK